MTGRPTLLVGVAGTGTEVGKTWVGAETLWRLRQSGRSVAARKPVQSFALDGAGGPAAPTDAEVLAAASDDDPAVVCPPGRSYPLPMAPPMAARRLGRPPPLLSDLWGELTWPDRSDVGLVETVGGVRSPLADDGDSAALLQRLDPDVVVLVADAGLGVIHAVRAAVDGLRGFSTIVYLNRFEPLVDLHVLNAEWLAERDGLDVVTEVADLAGRLGQRWADLAGPDDDGAGDPAGDDPLSG